jgi:UDP-N-acetylglucosamine acyltransferase
MPPMQTKPQLNKVGAADIHPTAVVDPAAVIGAGCVIGPYCVIGPHVKLGENVRLIAHVSVGDFVIVGGLSAVHQYVRIGSYAIIGGMSGVEKDVIPFGLVKGERAHLAGLNLVGLERRGFNRDDVRDLRSAYRMLFAHEGTLAERLEAMAEHYKDQPNVGRIVEFIRASSDRPLCQPKSEEE